MALALNQDQNQQSNQQQQQSDSTSGGQLERSLPVVNQIRRRDAAARRSGKVPAPASSTKRSPSVKSPSLDCRSSLSGSPTPSNRYHPSKAFLAKCVSELQTLLEHIKDDFNDDFKSLPDDQFADLLIQVESEFKKRIHRCLLASRTFKFYNLLKHFESDTGAHDIIINQIQTSESSPANLCRPATILIPARVISSNTLADLIRRLYLDTDLSEEETKLALELIDWLKTNKPGSLKVRDTSRKSTDQKASFRTIVPDFKEQFVHTPSKNTEMFDQENKQDLHDEVDTNDVAEGSACGPSTRDGSLTRTSLTRTETFELIKSNSDSPALETPDLKRSLESENDDSEPFQPVTRTGLKPKKFTTPVGLRRTPKPASSVASKTPSEKSAKATLPVKPKVAIRNTAPKSGLNKTSSDGSSGDSSSIKNSSNVSVSSKPIKPSSTPPDSKNASKTLITRAQPISMERSQSPATASVRGSGRNFIAANKLRVSQMDKKANLQPPELATAATDTCESETDANEACFAEPLQVENLSTQLEKFSLISHSRLAEACAKMFVDAILSDITVLTGEDRQINAHKCILSARSPYLAEIISQQSLPSTDQTEAFDAKHLLKIDLSEFSYAAVYFSFMHIYSGIARIPTELDLGELSRLAHLLHVPTLKQVCQHNLQMSYCHFFHKPCNVCCQGILKTLPLAWRYDYSDLYSKCLQWIGSHFASVFCLKEFSELKPNDLLEECYSATLSQLTPNNIIAKTLECQKLLKNLPRVKWTESIICSVGRLLEDFCHYVADNYEAILQSESFLNLGKNCWECEILEENLLAAMQHLKPDMGCKTLIQLHKIECANELHFEETQNVSDSFASLVSKMRKYCERYLLKEATAVVHCASWRLMSPSLQKRIKDQAILSTDFDEPTKQLAAKPKLPSVARANLVSRHGSNNSPTGDSQRSAPTTGNRSPRPKDTSVMKTPESGIKSPNTTYLPAPRNKTAAARHFKVLK